MQQLSKRFNAVAPLAYSSLISRYSASTQPKPALGVWTNPTISDSFRLRTPQNFTLPLGRGQASTFFSWKSIQNKIVNSAKNSLEWTMNKIYESIMKAYLLRIETDSGFITLYGNLELFDHFGFKIVDIFTQKFEHAYLANDLITIDNLLKCMHKDTKSLLVYIDQLDGERMIKKILPFPYDKQSLIIKYAFRALQDKNYAVLKLFVRHRLIIDYNNHENLTTLFTQALLNRDIKAIEILHQCTTQNLFTFKYSDYSLSAEEILYDMLKYNDPRLNHTFVARLYALLKTNKLKVKTENSIRKYLGLPKKERATTSEKKPSEDTEREKASRKQTNRFKSSNPYIVFGVAEKSYTRSEINIFYRALAKEFHPDSSSSDNTQIMQKINAAREMLLAKCKS